MAYDFKKEDGSLYLTKTTPSLVEVPAMTFVGVAGSGDPNDEDGAYRRALELLYTFSYTVKMLKKGSWLPDGYFDFVVPPLEGFWWDEAKPFNGAGVSDKNLLSWVSFIRQPDFVTRDVFERVCVLAKARKPGLDLAFEGLRFVRFAEGTCAQILHRGSYDSEPQTIGRLGEYVESQGMRPDIAFVGDATPQEVLGMLDCEGGVPRMRFHHEIYLGDPRRAKPERLKTIIRHPVA